MPSLDHIHQFHCFEAPLALPPRVSPNSAGTLKLRMESASAAVHPLLPATTFWSYEGCVPGPTVVVKSGPKSVRVHFDNLLQDAGGTPLALPFASVTGAADPAMNEAGSADCTVNAFAAGLTPWTATHLHGAATHPDSDGWPENVDPPGSRTDRSYQFAPEVYTVRDTAGNVVQQFDGGRAPTFWYHDHVMSATRFNVYAGLAGMWLVRDPIEATLDLPKGSDELVLVVQDRNFETTGGASGDDLTGALLHKNTDGTMECFAPATLVNGALWPTHAVRPRLGRLRLVNGSNARVYRLHFMGRKSAIADPQPLPSGSVQQIGTDGGLLGSAIDLVDLVDDHGNPVPGSGCLVLAPGERADLLVDFGGLAQAGWDAIEVYNSASAPYNSAAETLAQLSDVYTPDAAGFRPYPAVMRFTFRQGPKKPQAIQHMALLGATFKRLGHADLPADHGHSLVVLREENGTLYLHEMRPEAEADAMGMNLYQVQLPPPASGRVGIRVMLPQEPQHAGPPADVSYVTVAKRFHDGPTIFIGWGAWHVWRVLNLSPDTHPFHLHLVQFQGLSRTTYLPVAPMGSDGPDYVFTTKQAPVDLSPAERGWKDTLRANPGQRDDASGDIQSAELLTLAAQFTRHAGRYVYHCHILEHEDQDMMRHFVVVPPQLMGGMPGM